MRTKLFFLFCCLLLTSSFSASAQKHEFGMWLGGADYFGDLNTETNLIFFNPAGGLFYRHNFDERIASRINLDAGRVWADDAYSNTYYEYTRNLGFASNIIEASGQIEFNFMPYSTSSNGYMNAKHKFSPYVLVGFGVFHFNPFARYNGQKVHLQPLGTEGQGYPEYPELSRYKRTSTAFIFGGGFKFRVGRMTTVHIEGSVRKTATDYLDDVSGVYADPIVLLHEGGRTVEFLGDPSVAVLGEPIGAPGKMRGDSQKNDDYVFIGVGVSYTLRPSRCPYQK